MNITVEKGAACTASLNVEVPADKVAEQKKEIISTYAKNVNLKGFRPGKAPASIIEKRFGGDITNELNNKLINLGCQEAIKQEDLEVLSVNVADEPTLADDGALSFKAELILSPVFDLPKYKGIELEGRAIEVTDKDVSDALEGLQQRFAEYNEVERAAEDGDIVVIDFKTSLDGKPVKEVVGKDVGFLEGREGHWARVEEEGFLPGLGMGLKGLKSGEKKEVTVTMPDEFPISEVCGTDIVFDVEVKEIKEQQLPELNEEFVGKFVPDKSMDEFKELLTDQLKAEKEKEVNDELVQQVVKHLDETTEVVLPEALLEQEIQGTKYRMIENAKQQGMTEEMIKEQEADIDEAAATQGEQSLKTNFILKAIAEEEKIEITDDEVFARVHQLAQEAGMEVDKYAKELKKANAVDGVRNSVLVGKIIDYIVEQAEVTEVEADAEETKEEDAE